MTTLLFSVSRFVTLCYSTTSKTKPLTEDGEALSRSGKMPLQLCAATNSENSITNTDAPRWYAVYTWSRHEKSVANHLLHRHIEHLLPVYETERRWRNGNAKVSLPLFPGYIFVRISRTLRASVLQVSGVVQMLGAGKCPTPLSDDEVELLRRLNQLDHKSLGPHPYLANGRCVRIDAGPLAGLSGTVKRSKRGHRFVVSVDMIMRSVEIELDARDLRSAA